MGFPYIYILYLYFSGFLSFFDVFCPILDFIDFLCTIPMFFDVFCRVVFPSLIWPFFGFDFFGPIQRDGIFFYRFFVFWPFLIFGLFLSIGFLALFFIVFLPFFYRSFFWTVLVECGISRAISFCQKTRKSRKKSKK